MRMCRDSEQNINLSFRSISSVSKSATSQTCPLAQSLEIDLSMAKNTCSTLRIVFMAFLVSISLKSVHGVCEIDQNLTDSTVYALSITEDGTPFRVAGEFFLVFMLFYW